MKFYPILNRDKGDTYVKALQNAGHEILETYDADFVLVDYERTAIRWQLADYIHKGGKVFIYPHSATFDIIWDGLYMPLGISCNFTFGEGQRKVMKAYGYPHRTEAVGWPYFRVRPFKPTEGKKLLFAPAHPNEKGMQMVNEDRRAISMALDLILANQKKFDTITFRYAGDLTAMGVQLTEDLPIHTEVSDFTLEAAMRSIMRSDIVISNGTFGYLAVSLGVPTIFYGQEIPPHNIYRTVNSYETYRKIREFPLSLGMSNFSDMVYLACLGSLQVDHWKSQFIGDNFDAERFVSIIEKSCRRQ